MKGTQTPQREREREHPIVGGVVCDTYTPNSPILKKYTSHKQQLAAQRRPRRVDLTKPHIHIPRALA